MNALVIAGVNLTRLFRDRTSLFFVFLLPVVLIVVLGAMYGGRVAPRLGIVSEGSGPLGADLVARMEEGPVRLEIKPMATEAALTDAVERGTIEMGVVIPAGYDAALRGGERAEIAIVGQPAQTLALRQAVSSAIAAQSGEIAAARLAVAQRGVPFEAALSLAGRVAPDLPGVTVAVEDVGERIFPLDIGMFSLGAQSQLVLFMFLTSMTAATQLILTRQLGVSRRMLSTPVSVGTIVTGEALGRFAVAMVQGLFIVLISATAFSVDWGDPVAAALLVVAFALVGTGTAMVIGVFGSNADQAGTVGVFLGMALGALGGAMIPIEIFGEPMRTIAHVTPHAWAIDGFRALIFEHGGIASIMPELTVLLAMAVGLLALATWRFRRTLTG